MTQISSLTPADLKLAYEIEQASHLFPWSEKVFISNQGERYFNLKLQVNNQIVAFAITQVILDEATLFNIAVHPDQQKQGYGRSLLRYLIDTLPEKGIHTLWLEVRASNQAALHLYEQLGFNVVTQRRNYYPTATGREDALVMALTLA